MPVRTAWLVGLALLSGCVSSPHDGLETGLLNSPSPRSLMPDVGALPLGFYVGWGQEAKEEGLGAVDGHVTIFEQGNATEQHRVVVRVFRFASPAHAEAQFERMNQSDPARTLILLGPDKVLRRQVRGDPAQPEEGYMGTDDFLAHPANYVVSLTASARGGHPIDGGPLLEQIVARISSGTTAR